MTASTADVTTGPPERLEGFSGNKGYNLDAVVTDNDVIFENGKVKVQIPTVTLFIADPEPMPPAANPAIQCRKLPPGR